MNIKGFIEKLFSRPIQRQEGKDYDPESIVELLSQVTVNGYRLSSGHIHIHVLDFSDHLVFIWQEGMFRRIVAKSREQRKGRYRPLRNSEFRKYFPMTILARLQRRLGMVRLQYSDIEFTWPLFEDFMAWLKTTPHVIDGQ